MEPPFPHFDKMVHAGLFGTLCLLLALSLRSSAPKMGTRRLLALAVLASFTYGITDEIHQAFVPGRSCDTLDALADLAGAILVAFSLGFSRKVR